MNAETCVIFSSDEASQTRSGSFRMTSSSMMRSSARGTVGGSLANGDPAAERDLLVDEPHTPPAARSRASATARSASSIAS